MDDSIDFPSTIDNEHEDSDTEAYTAAQIIELMESAWMNEKFAPEILPHKTEVVECLLGQLTFMANNLENLHDNDLQKELHQLEVDRLRYLAASYLRYRLEKIEMHVLHILRQEEARAERNEDLYLSDNERQFANEYKEAMEQHFDSVLSFWPGLRPDNWKNEHVVPSMYSFVFLKSKAEIEGVVIDEGNNEEGDLVDFKQGSQMIISYNSVANLVKNGDVQLI